MNSTTSTPLQSSGSSQEEPHSRHPSEHQNPTTPVSLTNSPNISHKNECSAAMAPSSIAMPNIFQLKSSWTLDAGVASNSDSLSLPSPLKLPPPTLGNVSNQGALPQSTTCRTQPPPLARITAAADTQYIDSPRYNSSQAAGDADNEPSEPEPFPSERPPQEHDSPHQHQPHSPDVDLPPKKSSLSKPRKSASQELSKEVNFSTHTEKIEFSASSATYMKIPKNERGRSLTTIAYLPEHHLGDKMMLPKPRSRRRSLTSCRQRRESLKRPVSTCPVSGDIFAGPKVPESDESGILESFRSASLLGGPHCRASDLRPIVRPREHNRFPWRPLPIVAFSKKFFDISKAIHAVFPELKVLLSHLTHRHDGTLIISKRVSKLLQRKVLYDQTKKLRPEAHIWQREDFNVKSRIEMHMDNLRKHGYMKHMLTSAVTYDGFVAHGQPFEGYLEEGYEADKIGGATIIPEVLENKLGMEIQIPESFILDSALEWEGDCLTIKPQSTKKMLQSATMWIPGNHPILQDFAALSAFPEDTVLDDLGNMDILRTHLMHGRPVWITETDYYESRRMGLQYDQTALFDDVRTGYFQSGNDRYLRLFCEDKSIQWTPGSRMYRGMRSLLSPPQTYVYSNALQPLEKGALMLRWLGKQGVSREAMSWFKRQNPLDLEVSFQTLLYEYELDTFFWEAFWMDAQKTKFLADEARLQYQSQPTRSRLLEYVLELSKAEECFKTRNPQQEMPRFSFISSFSGENTRLAEAIRQAVLSRDISQGCKRKRHLRLLEKLIMWSKKPSGENENGQDEERVRRNEPIEQWHAICTRIDIPPRLEPTLTKPPSIIEPFSFQYKKKIQQVVEGKRKTEDQSFAVAEDSKLEETKHKKVDPLATTVKTDWAHEGEDRLPLRFSGSYTGLPMNPEIGAELASLGLDFRVGSADDRGGERVQVNDRGRWVIGFDFLNAPTVVQMEDSTWACAPRLVRVPHVESHVEEAATEESDDKAESSVPAATESSTSEHPITTSIEEASKADQATLEGELITQEEATFELQRDSQDSGYISRRTSPSAELELISFAAGQGLRIVD